MSFSVPGAIGSLLLAGACVLGCSTNADDSVVGDVPGVDTGILVQNWSIEGVRESSKCAQYNADRMRVVVFDEDGSVHATEFASCSSFELRLELLARRYTGAATFLDANGKPVSQTLTIPDFVIQDHLDLTQNIDFSAAQMVAEPATP
jgi:hypothetical protein